MPALLKIRRNHDDAGQASVEQAKVVAILRLAAVADTSLASHQALQRLVKLRADIAFDPRQRRCRPEGVFVVVLETLLRHGTGDGLIAQIFRQVGLVAATDVQVPAKRHEYRQGQRVTDRQDIELPTRAGSGNETGRFVEVAWAPLFCLEVLQGGIQQGNRSNPVGDGHPFGNVEPQIRLLDVQRQVATLFQRGDQQRLGECFDRPEPTEHLRQFAVGCPAGLQRAFKLIPIRGAGLG
ncbi:hypothetical protein HU806_12795 [Pseudomonas sp. SWRI154]|nr:hypothetical protein [Pseudomonas sp. SWRI154]MBC3363978.1 hypothetical protein [Pseudomonas sp. SWRI154]